MCVWLCSTRQVFVADTCSSSSADHLSMAPHLGRETTLSSLAHTHMHTQVQNTVGYLGRLGQQSEEERRGEWKGGKECLACTDKKVRKKASW